MSPELSAILATVGVSVLSFSGLFLLATKLWNDRIEMRLVSFAAGVLLATVFLDLLPEAIEEAAGNTEVLIASLGAMLAFFYIERLLHGRHSHSGHESHVHHHTNSRYFILIGDGAHNFIDGVAIGASFLVSPELGVATTIAVAAHEIPHEVADFAVLTHGGYSRRRALFLNFLSALTAVAGAGAVFLFGDLTRDNLEILLAASAGMFLYIAAANLIPELHHQRVKGRFMYGLPLLLGVLVIFGTIQALPHEHAEGTSVEDASHDLEADEADRHEDGPEESH